MYEYITLLTLYFHGDRLRKNGVKHVYSSEIWQNSCRQQVSEWEQGVETTGTEGKDCYKTGKICLEDNCQKSKERKILINFNFLINFLTLCNT